MVDRPRRIKRHQGGNTPSGEKHPHVGRQQSAPTAAGKESQAEDAARCPLCSSVSPLKLSLYTCINNYSKYPASSLWAPALRECPPKQLSFLNLDVLTIRTVVNENHSWAVGGTRRRNAMRKHDHIKKLFKYFESTHGISQPTITSINERMLVASPEVLLWLQCAPFKKKETKKENLD